MAKTKNSTAKISTATAVLLTASQTPPDASTEQNFTAATEAGSASTGANESTAKVDTTNSPEPSSPESKEKPNSDPAKDEKPKPGEMTPVQKAAKFVGIPVDQVFFLAEKEGGRFVVVTVSGHKFNNTPAEREAATKQAADEVKARAVLKAAKAKR